MTEKNQKGQKNLRQKLIEGANYTEKVELPDYEDAVIIRPILDTAFMKLVGDTRETFDKLNDAGLADADLDSPEAIKVIAGALKQDKDMMTFLFEICRLGIVPGQGLHDIVEVPDWDAGLGPNGETQMKAVPVYMLFGRMATVEVALRILDLTMPRKGALEDFFKAPPGTKSSSRSSSAATRTTSESKAN